MNTIGIDPGSQSGVVVLGSLFGGAHPLLYVERVKVRERDLWLPGAAAWIEILRHFAPAIAVIEAQHVARSGHAGSLIPAQVDGWWAAIAQAAGCSIASVQPSTWQAHHGIKRRSKHNPDADTKKQARAIALVKFGRCCDKADIADAALMADWARARLVIPLVWEAVSHEA